MYTNVERFSETEKKKKIYLPASKGKTIKKNWVKTKTDNDISSLPS